jgi:hypothetical protein
LNFFLNPRVDWEKLRQGDEEMSKTAHGLGSCRIWHAISGMASARNAKKRREHRPKTPSRTAIQSGLSVPCGTGVACKQQSQKVRALHARHSHQDGIFKFWMSPNRKKAAAGPPFLEGR